MRKKTPPAPLFPLRMTPHLDPRPWGGRRLETVLGKSLPPKEPIGESWEISAIAGKVSRVAGGPLDGMGFDEVLRRWPEETLGRLAGSEFPLLVKFIDAAEPLSVQVHPDDAMAQSLAGAPRGKTEAWLILDALPDGRVIHGLIEGAVRADLERAASTPRIGDFLRWMPIRPGSIVPVPAGTVHALLEGTLLCEVQQSSDLTYRLYDWDRKPTRPLHIRESLDSIRYEPPPDIFHLPPTPPWRRTPPPFLDMGYFSMALIETGGAAGFDCMVEMGDGDFALLVVLEDEGTPIEVRGFPPGEKATEPMPLRKGQSLFCPAALEGIELLTLAGALALWIRPGE